MVNKSEVFSNPPLTIQMDETDSSISLKWLGKSVDRRPGKFIAPILADVLMRCGDGQKRMIMDFRAIEYMNSSTITPIIKILERAQSSSVHISVNYDGSLNWQDLTFSALRIFETEDGRVVLEGR